MDSATVQPSELQQHWRLLVAATVGMALGMPTLALFSIGIFAPIFSKEFGWPFAAIMGGLMFASVLILAVGPWVGRVIDKRGARSVAVLSLGGLGLGYMTFGLASGSLVQYYLSWLLFAVLGMGATAISFSHAINERFSRQRGIALGITLAGSGIYAVLVKVLGTWLIAAIGWRMTMGAIGALPLLVGIPLVLWGFPRRGAVAAAARQGGRGEAGIEHTGLSARSAFRNRAFWLIALAFVPIALANGAPLPNMENILKTLRIGAAEVVQVTSLIGLSILVGRVAGGWLIDHFWAPAVASILLVCAAGGCLILAQDHVSMAQAALAVVLLCVAAGMEFDLLAFLIARYIGVRSYGTVYSVLFGMFAIGAGGGPALLARAFDVTGSYASGLVACGAGLALATIPLLLLGAYPQFTGATGATGDRHS